MVSHSWLIILSISFFIMTMSFITLIIFFIFAAIELRKASASLRAFLKNTEERLVPLIQDAEQTVGHAKKISENLGTVSDNIREVSVAATEVTTNLRALSGLVEEVHQGLSLRVIGVKAGLKTAMNVFMNKMKEGGHRDEK